MRAFHNDYVILKNAARVIASWDDSRASAWAHRLTSLIQDIDTLHGHYSLGYHISKFMYENPAMLLAIPQDTLNTTEVLLSNYIDNAIAFAANTANDLDQYPQNIDWQNVRSFMAHLLQSQDE